MSVSNRFISENLLEFYVKTPLSLTELAMTKLAIQLCHYSPVKQNIIYISKSLKNKAFSRHEWEEFIEFESIAVCDTLGLPTALKIPLIVRIQSIAMEMFIWNRRYQVMLLVSPDGADQFLTPSDWTEEGRIKEKNVAARVVQDAGIPVCYRYQIACLNCLEPIIRSLWYQIPPESKGNYYCPSSRGCRFSKLIWVWSCYLSGTYKKVLLGKDDDMFLQRLLEEAIREGEKTAIIYCWKSLSEIRKQEVIMAAAQCALTNYDRKNTKFWMSDLIKIDELRSPPAHYSDILYYFFSQMSELQRVEFLKASLKPRISPFRVSEVPRNFHVLACFIESPYQSYFKHIFCKLWGILSEEDYGLMIVLLTGKLMDVKENQVFDYGHLLLELLEEPPEHYKRYIFTDKSIEGKIKNEGKELLLAVLKKQPIDPRDKEIIQNILKHATVEEKQSIIDSQCGKDLCKHLMKNKNWEIIDLILASGLSEYKIVDFKKKFLLSDEMNIFCLRILETENEDSLISLLNWGSFTKDEISNFKFMLIHASKCIKVIIELLVDLQMDCIYRILKFCLPSEDFIRQFKKQFVTKYSLDICLEVLEHSHLERLTRILTWAFPSEEDISNFKGELYDEGYCVLMQLTLIKNKKWHDANNLIEWCRISPKNIEQFKKDVVFSSEILERIYDELYFEYDDLTTLPFCLEWGLSEAETAMTFKNVFTDYALEWSEKYYDDAVQLIQQRLDQLLTGGHSTSASSSSDKRAQAELFRL